MLGEVPRFEGEITPTLLQVFVRAHGADKPKGAKVDDGLFTVECAALLPLHIGDGKGDYLTLEPSAGTGQLARALIASGHSPQELTMIERHHKLASLLRQIGPTIHRCFLESLPPDTFSTARVHTKIVRICRT
ncbi:hypothetical protein PhaeoP23_03699 (plasmid) [Phaeobacter piscinae]|uniref:Phospholipid N-methyltransferase n=2 Tax=Phaeobacter piscinae TaxID=1580596 RepID=A0ABN5DKT2_9RHOB|nr:hypothetical protein PhaeoP36_03699 [Phaeobacter piscinae]AUQ88297.1 hypothetical protein PhaeoP42_03700 [Phaeobacter piscinae]AUR26180.1 hypothetical protein PhaeoP23_03699 [Phaeobacter piscinae]